MNTVTMSGAFGYERINEFLSEVTSKHNKIIDKGVFDIDFTNLELIDPFGIVVLINLCRRFKKGPNVCSIINVPENMFPLHEFEKGFIDCVKIKYTKANVDFSNQLIKIFHLKTGHCSGTNLKEINRIVQTWALNNGVSKRQVFYGTNFIVEMLDNVQIHSKSDYCSLVLQLIKLGNGKTRLVLAIGDNGIGIRNSLLYYNCDWRWHGDWSEPWKKCWNDKSRDDNEARVNLRTQDDITSINFAIKYGMSKWVSEKRGSGLSGFGTLSREKDADLIIHSGTGICGIVDKNPIEISRNLRHNLIGTSICLVLHPM